MTLITASSIFLWNTLPSSYLHSCQSLNHTLYSLSSFQVLASLFSQKAVYLHSTTYNFSNSKAEFNFFLNFHLAGKHLSCNTDFSHVHLLPPKIFLVIFLGRRYASLSFSSVLKKFQYLPLRNIFLRIFSCSRICYANGSEWIDDLLQIPM